jgi:PPM family protein phosphatase
VGLMPIGEFARRSRLTPKALRLYDDLGLLRPARTDPRTGYRSYAPGQLERARLVASLRHLGMPLARIADVVALPPADAADAVAAYWRRVEAEHAARRELAATLVTHLHGGATTMPTTTPLRLRWATHSDRGLVREHQQDAVHAGEGLLAVADGYGPRTTTGSSALDALAGAAVTPGALVDVLNAAVEDAAAAVRGAAAGTPSGTTLTALAWAGSDVALVHVGDSRAYLLRDGELLLLTHDHTVTRRMVDAGELTEAEAATHPQRAILVRALGDGTADVHAQRVRAGDRYLLCTDGLHAPVPESAIRAGLREHAEPEAAVAALAALVRSVGAPDNTALVVADVLAA